MGSRDGNKVTMFIKPKCNHVSWNDILSLKYKKKKFELFNFNHPLYILYSSGTTGKPKCIVHGSGGSIIQHIKEHLSKAC